MRPSLVGALGVLAGAALVAFLILLAEPRDDDAVVIDVEVSRYRYDPGTDGPIVVPLGKEVVLRVRSADVTHGFAIEGYGVSEEIPAGRTVEIRFTATQAGDFRIYCTVFCGSEHPSHQGTLHVAA